MSEQDPKDGQQPPPPPQWGDTPGPPQYGQPVHPGYGAPQYGSQYGPQYGSQYGSQPGQYPPPPPGYRYAVPDEPGAQTALIVGILGLVLGFMCGVGFLASPFAWVLGARSKSRIDASGGRLGGRGNAQAGFVMGIIGTVLLVLAVLAVIGLVALIVAGVLTSDELDSSYTDYGTTA